MGPLTGSDNGSVGYAVEAADTSPKGQGPNGQTSAAVKATSENGFAVSAVATNSTGIYAATSSTRGSSAIWCESSGNGPAMSAYGHSPGSTGAYIFGMSVGLALAATQTGGIALRAQGPVAAEFTGPVQIRGGLQSALVARNGNGSGIAFALGGGVWGDSDNGWGVIGTSTTYDGVRGENSGNGAAIHGICHGTGGHAGMFEGAVQVNGEFSSASAKGAGVTGKNGAGSGIGVAFGGGVRGDSDNGWGVIGTSATYDGVRGENSGNGAAIHGICHGAGGHAGMFDGSVRVNGTVTVTGDIVLPGADCAEEFDVTAAAEASPGTVMVIGDDGALEACRTAYDRRVVGVVSGAGSYRSALTLDRSPDADKPRAAIALIGKAWCRADATAAPIAIGDLLTTSSTPGHSMRADPARAPGTILGKALAPLSGGTGIVPMLISLQ